MSEKTTFEQQLAEHGRLIYTNVGVSMMPLLREGKDIMIIDRIDGHDCKKYDAVFFVRPWVHKRGRYVVHRILKCNEDGTYYIVGDHDTRGETVKPENILGKLTAVVRNGKTINVTDKKYLFYVHLWCDFYPVRCLILKMKRFVRRCLGFVKRKVVGLLGK